jgi:hypothetical protein
MLFKFALLYVILKVQDNTVVVKQKENHQLLVYTDHANLLGNKTFTIKNTNTDTSKEVSMEVKAGKAKFILLSSSQNAGQSHDIKIAYRFFKNVTEFKYL